EREHVRLAGGDRRRRRPGRGRLGQGQRVGAEADGGRAAHFLAAGAERRPEELQTLAGPQDLDPGAEARDRGGAEETERGPRHVHARRGLLDGAREQGRRRAAVLVVGAPRSARQLRGDELAVPGEKERHQKGPRIMARTDRTSLAGPCPPWGRAWTA